MSTYSELQDTLNAILLDKNTNLRTYNLRKSVKCLGVEGQLEEGSGIDTSDATAYPQYILNGYTAYARDEKITGTYIPLNTSDATAEASDILLDKTAYVDGVKLVGTMLNHNNVEITPLVTPQTFGEGHYNQISVKAVDSSIDANIKPENIMRGIEILGVLGDAVIEATDATATAADVLGGKTAYLRNGITTGTMVNNGNTKITPKTTNVTIPAGYYNGNGYVRAVDSSIDSNIKASNIKSGVTILGVTGALDLLDTFDATANASTILNGYTAYIKGAKVTGTMPNNGVLRYTPRTTSITIPVGYANGGTIAAVDSSIDSNIKAENIKQGITILGVQGNAIANGIDTSDANATASSILTGNSAYVNGEKVNGNMPERGSLSIIPTTYSQGFNSGHYNSISVGAVTSGIDSDIKPENIRLGVNILGVNGTVVAEDTEKVTETITPQTYNVVKNNIYYQKLTVSAVTSNIDGNIQPENIKEGVSILGVQGTLNTDNVYISYEAGTLLMLAGNYYNYDALLERNTMVAADTYKEGAMGEDSKLTFTTDNQNRYAILRCYFNLPQGQEVVVKYKINNNTILFSQLDKHLSEDMGTSTNVYVSSGGSNSEQTVTYQFPAAGKHFFEIKVLVTDHSEATELTFKPVGENIRQRIISQVYASTDAMNADSSQGVGTYGYIFDIPSAKMTAIYRFNGEQWIISNTITDYTGTLTPEEYTEANNKLDNIIGE